MLIDVNLLQSMRSVTTMRRPLLCICISMGALNRIPDASSYNLGTNTSMRVAKNSNDNYRLCDTIVTLRFRIVLFLCSSYRTISSGCVAASTQLTFIAQAPIPVNAWEANLPCS